MASFDSLKKFYRLRDGYDLFLASGDDRSQCAFNDGLRPQCLKIRPGHLACIPIVQKKQVRLKLKSELDALIFGWMDLLGQTGKRKRAGLQWLYLQNPLLVKLSDEKGIRGS